jgi:dihydropteroate synthase
MGVLNVTPDSFSGDGLEPDPAALELRIQQLVSEGADLIDIGGESTRPGHAQVSPEEELRRVLPAVRVAARASIPISIDTRQAVVAREALANGASIVNDVSGLADGDMASVVAEAGARLVLVHWGTAAAGEDLLQVVVRGLLARIERAMEASIPREHLLIDPGLGMGKGWRENFEIVRRLRELRALELPVLVGASRKGMIGLALGLPPHERFEGSAALGVLCISGGVDVLRVHDVARSASVAVVTDTLARRA